MAFQRYATPNERRCIIRESLGFYNVVVVGGIYTFQDQQSDKLLRNRFCTAARACVAQHPCLAVVAKDAETERPYFERVSNINVRNHVEFVDLDESSLPVQANNDAEFIERALPRVLDTPLCTQQPPWKIVIHNILSEPGHQSSRYFVAFAFSHGSADGMSGLAFHRSLLDALNSDENRASMTTEKQTETDTLVFEPASTSQIAEPFDTKSRLPISWSYFLTPLLAVYLPAWLSSYFGLRAAASVVNNGTYTGSAMSYDANKFNTRVSVFEIKPEVVKAALVSAKAHRTKLTALLHGFVVRALSKAVDKYQLNTVTNLVSTTAVNMRRSVGLADNQMGMFVSGYYEMHDKASVLGETFSSSFWSSARKMTDNIAECAATLQDQPIGLLRLLPSIRSWTSGKVGKKRDASYEISNLGVFDPRTQFSKGQPFSCEITKMVFCQPANVVSAALVFNFVSTTGGALICAIDWQASALGVFEEQEDDFVGIIRERIKQDFQQFMA